MVASFRGSADGRCRHNGLAASEKWSHAPTFYQDRLSGMRHSMMVVVMMVVVVTVQG